MSVKFIAFVLLALMSSVDARGRTRHRFMKRQKDLDLNSNENSEELEIAKESFEKAKEHRKGRCNKKLLY